LMWLSDFATDRVPHPVVAKASAKAAAAAINRMQEYPVSVCFLNRTAPRILYIVFGGETQ
jgi:hypothetical protein